MAKQFLSAGIANCVMVVGFEKMQRGSLKPNFTDRAPPMEKQASLMAKTKGYNPKLSGAIQFFGNAGREYMDKYGAKKEDFAEVARVNHAHSVKNPYSQFQDVYTLEQIMESQEIFSPLTKLQCCPTSDGSASAVLVNQTFLDANPHLKSKAILLAGQALATDSPSVFDKSSINLIGYEMTKSAAQQAYAQAGIQPTDVQVVELHDCFSANEVVTIDALGLCPPGKAHELIRQGGITYGGKYVINPSGGLISKGHPLGATGLAQCAELVWQLRGWANNRLVPGVKVALQHNLGLGGAVVVGIYKRPDGKAATAVPDSEIAKLSGVGYNPAVEARDIDEAQIKRVVSKSKTHEWLKPKVLETPAANL